MDEQNRLRLARIAARYTRRSAEAPKSPSAPQASLPSAEEEFRAAFIQARENLIRPAMLAVAEQLELAGYSFRIRPGGTLARPAIDLYVELPDRAGSKDIVRFFPFLDPERGWQIVAELELKGKPFELRRFEWFEELRRDVLEQVIIDAIEQMFSSTESRAGGTGPSSPNETQAPEPLNAHVDVRHTEPAHTIPEAMPAAYPVGAPAEAEAPRARLPETQEVDVRAFRGALPFRGGSPAQEFFASVEVARAEGTDPVDDATGDETLPLIIVKPMASSEDAVSAMALPVSVDAARTGSLPFPGRVGAPVAVPELTLDKYAEFRARLSVDGEDDPEAWRAFGVGSRAAKEAVQASFAARFRADPGMQAQFVEHVRRLASALREGRSKR